jgi:hypothetical protein
MRLRVALSLSFALLALMRRSITLTASRSGYGKDTPKVRLT